MNLANQLSPENIDLCVVEEAVPGDWMFLDELLVCVISSKVCSKHEGFLTPILRIFTEPGLAAYITFRGHGAFDVAFLTCAPPIFAERLQPTPEEAAHDDLIDTLKNAPHLD